MSCPHADPYCYLHSDHDSHSDPDQYRTCYPDQHTYHNCNVNPDEHTNSDSNANSDRDRDRYVDGEWRRDLSTKGEPWPSNARPEFYLLEAFFLKQ
jgi:hypothetical protein